MNFIQFLIEDSDFKQLQKDKVVLTPDERAEVLSKKAVWHNGPNHSEVPAIWKSINKNGKVIYITHTHRAYNTAPSLKGCIGKFHNFIKGTA